MKFVSPILLIFLCSGCSSSFWGLPVSNTSVAHCVNPDQPNDSNEAVLRAFINSLKTQREPGPEPLDLGYATCLADAGSKYGQYVLGTKYLYGGEVEQDFVRAYDLFKKAAKTEVHNMAIYQPGFGDVPASVRLIEMAPPTPGHSGAMFYLGLMYLEGWGVKQSERKGKKWLKAAARYNNGLALGALQLYFPEEYEEKTTEENL